MAEEDLGDEEVGGDDAMEGDDEMMESSGKGGKKKLIIIAVVLLLVVGGVAGAFFTGLLEPVIAALGGGGEETATEEQAPAAPVAGTGVFFDVPELLVNLNTRGRKARHLKIRMALELGSASDQAILENVMPRVIDNFQVYLRELRIEDLQGSAGVYRLREELLRRVSAAAAPAQINDVLFREMLVQ